MSKHLFVLGPKGTHSHLAAVKFLDEFSDLSKESIVFCQSNAEVLSRTEEEKGICIVAFENSLGGLVDESIRFWLRQQSNCSVQVIAERYLRVRHNLLMRQGGRAEDITKIISHPQALSQCSENIKRICPEAVISEVNSTAAAAQNVSEDVSGTVAAVAPGFAAMIYGLETVQRHIHDDHLNNMTRFHVVSHNSMSDRYRKKVSEVHKTAVIFQVPNIPGSLVNILSPISKKRVNISSIHSIPLGEIGKFAFYCEFDVAQFSPKGKVILDEMRMIDSNLFLIGSFSSSLRPHL